MPLRDHFHSPVNDRHSWDSLHGQWPAMLVLQLSRELPPEFVAAPKIHLGGSVEIDVGAYGRAAPTGPPAIGSGGTALATRAATEPTLRVETDLPDVDEYEVQIYDMSRGRRLVAAIELVSPSNKDRPETRRAFVTKCAALLQQQVSVMIVDVVTVREFNLYAELLAFLGQTDPTVSKPPTSIYAAACRYANSRKNWLLEGWHRPLAIGQPLPALPLWLAENLVFTLDLEPSYEETCRVLRIA